MRFSRTLFAARADVPGVIPRGSPLVFRRPGDSKLTAQEKSFVWQWAQSGLEDMLKMTADDATRLVEMMGKEMESGEGSFGNAELLALLRLLFQFDKWFIMVAEERDDTFKIFSFAHKHPSESILGVLSKPEFLPLIQAQNPTMQLRTKQVTSFQLMDILFEGQFSAVSLNPGVMGKYVVLAMSSETQMQFMRIGMCGAACFNVLAGDQKIGEVHGMLESPVTTFYYLHAWNKKTEDAGAVMNNSGPVVYTSADQIVQYPLEQGWDGEWVPAAVVIGGDEVVALAEQYGQVALAAVSTKDRSFIGMQLNRGDWEKVAAHVTKTKV